MEPHLPRGDYWTRERIISKGGAVDGIAGLDVSLVTMAGDSHAFEPIRRYILTGDIKGSNRTDIIGGRAVGGRGVGGRNAPSKSYKKQSNRTKPQHPE